MTNRRAYLHLLSSLRPDVRSLAARFRRRRGTYRLASRPSEYRLGRAVWLRRERLSIGLYVLILSAISFGGVAGPERWWWSTLNLFLPQWVWGIPGLVLLGTATRIDRRAAFLLLVCLAWVAGPIMGLCWHLRSPSAARRDSVRVRVMTYNVKWGRKGGPALVAEIARNDPDLLLMQDSGAVMDGLVGGFVTNWNVQRFGQYVIASRQPLSQAEVRWISFGGHPHTCLRCEVTAGGRRFVVYDVHLLTAREPLSDLRSLSPGAIEEFGPNAADRLLQAAELAAEVAKERGPVIVAGDLNSPPTSIACRKLAQIGLRDAFSESGWGYGYTYGQATRFSHSFLRIDHVFASRDWTAIRCWAGGGDGSDHRPVVADLVLR